MARQSIKIRGEGGTSTMVHGAVVFTYGGIQLAAHPVARSSAVKGFYPIETWCVSELESGLKVPDSEGADERMSTCMAKAKIDEYGSANFKQVIKVFIKEHGALK